MLRRLFRQPSGTPGLTGKDRAIFEQLRGLGVDFTRPRHIDHFFLLRNEEAARGLAAHLPPPLETSVRQVSGIWSVQTSLVMPLSEEMIASTRPNFEALAKRYGGSYDGWGAEADPPN